LTADLYQRQQEYLGRSNPVTIHDIADWPIPRRLWNNTIAMLGPVL
jgi:cardiolipin synthase